MPARGREGCVRRPRAVSALGGDELLDELHGPVLAPEGEELVRAAPRQQLAEDLLDDLRGQA